MNIINVKNRSIRVKFYGIYCILSILRLRFLGMECQKSIKYCLVSLKYIAVKTFNLISVFLERYSYKLGCLLVDNNNNIVIQ